MTKKQSIKYTDIVYGVHPVIELLASKRLKISAIYTLNHPIKAWEKIKALIPAYMQVQQVTRETLDNVAGTTEHQGVLAFVSPFPSAKAMFSPAKQPFILILDEIQDVRNLGAILRSAYCTGVDGVVLCQRNSAPLTPAAIKASAGLVFYLPIFVAPSIKSAILMTEQAGYNLYYATLGQGENASKVAFKSPTALVIGNEEVGIAKAAIKSGTCVLLPQRRSDISYNASVAAGILLYSIGVQLGRIS